MNTTQAAALAIGQKVIFNDGRSATVVDQALPMFQTYFPDMQDFAGHPVTLPRAAGTPVNNVVKLQFDDSSIGYLRWQDMSTVSLV